jgi:ribosome maturation factor RimP
MGFVDLQKVRSLVEPVVGQLGYELIDVRFLTDRGRRLLRILVDREGGVSVGDCERVSREIETLLEVEEAVRERYDLEVSSPGFDRPLVKESDFARFAGKNAALKTKEPVVAYGGRRNYKGLLKGVEEGVVVMMIDGKEFRIPLGLVERAHLVF